jgi:DNA repair exonuclease SbcCD ATPase subunit
LPNVNQAIELLSAPEELKTEVMARIESGDDVSIKEIRELKKQLNEQGKLLLSKNCELFSKDEQLQSALKMIDGYIAVNKQYPIIEKAPADYEQNKNDLLEANNKIQQLENEMVNANNELKRVKNKQAQLANDEKQAHENEISALEKREQTIQKNIDDLLAFQKKLNMKDRLLKSRLETYEEFRQALVRFSGNIYDYTGMIDIEVETTILNGLKRACNDCSRAIEFILDNRPPPTEKSAIGYERVN